MALSGDSTVQRSNLPRTHTMEQGQQPVSSGRTVATKLILQRPPKKGSTWQTKLLLTALILSGILGLGVGTVGSFASHGAFHGLHGFFGHLNSLGNINEGYYIGMMVGGGALVLLGAGGALLQLKRYYDKNREQREAAVQSSKRRAVNESQEVRAPPKKGGTRGRSRSWGSLRDRKNTTASTKTPNKDVKGQPESNTPSKDDESPPNPAEGVRRASLFDEDDGEDWMPTVLPTGQGTVKEGKGKEKEGTTPSGQPAQSGGSDSLTSSKGEAEGETITTEAPSPEAGGQAPATGEVGKVSSSSAADAKVDAKKPSLMSRLLGGK